MTVTAQSAPPAQVAVAGFTLAAPRFAEHAAPLERLDLRDVAATPAVAVSARQSHDSDCKTVQQCQGYATALKHAYAHVDVQQNPALAALAANIALLAQPEPSC